MVLLAFIGMTLAWSFSWFAMKLQVLSSVPVEVSVFYRFFFTSILMFILCLIFKQRILIKKSELPFFFFIGLCNFCLNFLIGYHAVKYVPSGVLAMIFSLSIISSEIIASIVESRKIERKVIISSIIGIFGLALFILPAIDFSSSDNSKTIIGFTMAIIMMLVYSSGNVIVSKNRAQNATPLYTSIAYGSLFGSIFLLIVNFIFKNEFSFDFSPSYLGSLIYLVVIASVIAFICLFYMIQKIGAAKANYTALIYPVIALITSAFLEGFQFTPVSIIGVVLIILAILVEFI